ncbi:MAG: cyclic pyranopterin monophosphate synthase MoaC [Alphaproteobacteria bacterium]|nr:cyclic pyranopterin monophosphate synthase MoaC [Alphaproteobacteria bacterium]
MSGELTHFDATGNARMVDVGGKEITERIAVARATVTMLPATLELIANKKAAKGDVLAVAQLAGIMAAKRTADLIPLCHPLALSSVELKLSLDKARNAVDIEATCKLKGRTGVEMELLHKSGGKSGTWQA